MNIIATFPFSFLSIVLSLILSVALSIRLNTSLVSTSALCVKLFVRFTCPPNTNSEPSYEAINVSVRFTSLMSTSTSRMLLYPSAFINLSIAISLFPETLAFISSITLGNSPAPPDTSTSLLSGFTFIFPFAESMCKSFVPKNVFAKLLSVAV